MLLALVATGTVFAGSLPDGFIANRTLLLGLVAMLFVAFLGKLLLRTVEDCRREHHEAERELAGTTGNGPPSFNG